MDFQTSDIELTDIDVTNKMYRITTNPAMDDLTASIGRIGVINDPTVIAGENGWIVVCGFRRIEACRLLKRSRIRVGIPVGDSVSGADPFILAELAVSDNALQRPLNWIETARSLALLSQFVEGEKQFAETAKRWGLPDNPNHIQNLMDLLRLPDSIQDGIVSGIVAFPAALDLGEFTAEECDMFSDLFRLLKSGLNIQRETIVLVKETALREGVPIANILETILQIAENDETDPNRKTAAVRDYLKRRRYPAVTRLETEFENRVKALKLGDGVKFTPPRYFEGNMYSINLNFNGPDKLQKQLDSVRKITEQPEIFEKPRL